MFLYEQQISCWWDLHDEFWQAAGEHLCEFSFIVYAVGA